MTNQVIHGDCMDIMREMEANSVDTIITDPPYHLGSISKRFTKASLGDDNDTAANARNGSNQYARLSTGFMGARWDGGGIAFQPELWAEMLRVAKPGATLMAFGGTRTHHRLMCAIEDAGWEIRDCLMFLYGSGFPKSHAIGKAIDRAKGKEREVAGRVHPASKYDNSNRSGGKRFEGDTMQWGKEGYSRLIDVTTPATEAAATWEGYGSGGLKPAYEPIIYAQKPIDGTYANNAQVWGVGGLWIDGGRIATNGRPNIEGDYKQTENNTYAGRMNDSLKGGSKANGTTNQGRWPANVLLSHAEGCVRRGEKRVRAGNKGGSPGGFGAANLYGDGKTDIDVSGGYADPNGLETVADWECVENCPVRILDEQAGVRKSGGGIKKPANQTNFHWSLQDGRKTVPKSPIEIKGIGGDSGSASRFFYTAKAPNREKWFFCQLCAHAYPNAERDNHGHDIDQGQRKHIVAHPTVKPQSILNYLCKLTKTPTGGIVLDPFAGSGTTALACLETGRDFILIEKESDYYQIAKARVEAAMKEPRQAELW